MQAVGQPPRALVCRNDFNQLAFLNNRASDAEVSCQYKCHTFTGAAQDREQVKRITRIKVYGDGVVTVPPPTIHPAPPLVGVLTVTADNLRTDTYVYSALSPDPLTGALWAQYGLGLKGRTFDITIQLTGVGIKVREVSMEYVLIN